MSDGLAVEMETRDVVAALLRVPDVVERHLRAAARETAEAIATEARSRLRRQLGPHATGALERSISAQEDYTGNGYIILTDLAPEQHLSLHTSKKTSRAHTQAVTVNMLPIWVEKGTHKGAPRSHTEADRPFFYVSVLLEAGAHERRVIDALHDAADECGLGE